MLPHSCSGTDLLCTYISFLYYRNPVDKIATPDMENPGNPLPEKTKNLTITWVIKQFKIKGPSLFMILFCNNMLKENLYA